MSDVRIRGLARARKKVNLPPLWGLCLVTTVTSCLTPPLLELLTHSLAPSPFSPYLTLPLPSDSD